MTGTLTGMPINADVGTTTDIVISVTSGGETASLDAFDLEVTNTNDTPTIIGNPPTSVAEDTTYTFTPMGEDIDGTPLAYSINKTPNWATFSTMTGILTGTPRNADVGTTTGIVISVISGGETVSLDAFDLEVTNTNDAPTIIGNPATSVAENATYTFTPMGEDVDTGSTLVYSINKIPNWATFTTTTGTLTGTPRNADVGTTTGIVISVISGGETVSLDAFDLEVTNINDAPIAVADTDKTEENTEITIDVFANDTDVDADDNPTNFSLDAVNIASGLPTPRSGTPATATIKNNRLVFNPGTDFDYLADGITTDLVINYTMSDGDDATSSSTVTITITGENDAPTANAGNYRVVYGDTLLALDGSSSTDPEGENLTYTWTAPSFITLSDNNAVRPVFRTPGQLLGNIDLRFSLKVNDGIYDSQIATVTIRVACNRLEPIAVATTDTPVVPENTVVTLDGSGSSTPDPDNVTLSYIWTSPPGITLSSNSDANTTFTAPSNLLVDTDYEFSLTVYNGNAYSEPDTVTVRVMARVNLPPTAVATTTTPIVDRGTVVMLNGSSSSDPEGIPLDYIWTAPTDITLSDNTAANPTFTTMNCLLAGIDLKFSLIVNDKAQNSQPTTVTVRVMGATNPVPTSVVRTVPIVHEGTVVTLYGSESSSGNPNNDNLSYIWTSPAGIYLSSNAGADPTFTAPKNLQTNTDYEFSLTVYNGNAYSESVSVTVTVIAGANLPPTAVAKTTTPIVGRGAVVMLDGGSSTDPEGTAMTYIWTAPAGITLSDSDVSNPNLIFTVPRQLLGDTDFTFSLTVNDGAQNSPTVTLTVRVTDISLSADQFSINNISVSPNPVSDILNTFRFSEISIFLI